MYGDISNIGKNDYKRINRNKSEKMSLSEHFIWEDCNWLI